MSGSKVCDFLFVLTQRRLGRVGVILVMWV